MKGHILFIHGATIFCRFRRMTQNGLSFRKPVETC